MLDNFSHVLFGFFFTLYTQFISYNNRLIFSFLDQLKAILLQVAWAEMFSETLRTREHFHPVVPQTFVTDNLVLK